MAIRAPGSAAKLTVPAMGIAQILAWGSTYYLPAVLAQPIARDTGWSLPMVIAGLSCGLLVAGLCAPRVGHLIQLHGGRPVLMSSSVLIAIGLVTLAHAWSIASFVSAWCLLGIGMSAGLYDAAFATLGKLFGRDARRHITTLTLFGGFASTVCWPLSAFLVDGIGWRDTCLVYAAIHLFVCLPLYAGAVPIASAVSGKTADVGEIPAPPPDLPGFPLVFVLLALILTFSALIASMLSVQLLTVLQLRGYDLAAAVALGALVGPSQVGARIVEMLAGRHYHPIWTMLASVTLIAIGVGLLLLQFPLPALALIVYGAGNGIHSIARGSLPLVLFHPHHYPVLMGRLAFPSLIVQAAAPSIGAWLIGTTGTPMLALLTAAACINILLCLALLSLRHRQA